jgi:hypothetical protein
MLHCIGYWYHEEQVRYALFCNKFGGQCNASDNTYGSTDITTVGINYGTNPCMKKKEIQEISHTFFVLGNGVCRDGDESTHPYFGWMSGTESEVAEKCNEMLHCIGYWYHEEQVRYALFCNKFGGQCNASDNTYGSTDITTVGIKYGTNPCMKKKEIQEISHTFFVLGNGVCRDGDESTHPYFGWMSGTESEVAEKCNEMLHCIGYWYYEGGGKYALFCNESSLLCVEGNTNGSTDITTVGIKYGTNPCMKKNLNMEVPTVFPFASPAHSQPPITRSESSPAGDLSISPPSSQSSTHEVNIAL